MKQTVAKATPWTAASTLVGMFAQLGVVAVLARVLSDHDYGVTAASIIVLGLFQVFLGAGLTPAIVQRLDVTQNELQSVHWLNLGFATMLTTLSIVFSPFVAGAFGVSDAQPVVALASLAFVISALGQVPQAIMEKNLDFRVLAIAEIMTSLIMFLTSVIAAFSGAGAFSMALGMIAGEAVRAGFYLYSARHRYRPGLHFRFSETKRFLGFGLITTVDVMLNYWSSNISAMATGRLLGARALGGYNLSLTLGYSMPGRINPIVTRIMFPVLASIQTDRPRVRRAYLRTVEQLGVVNFVGLGFLAAAAPAIVPVAYGERWSWVVPTAAIVCLAGVLRGIGFPMGPLLAALDHVKLGFAVNVVKTAIVLPMAIYLTEHYGLSGAAWAMVGAQVVSLIISAGLLKYMLDLKVLSYLRVVVDAALFAAPMMVAVWFAQHAMAHWPNLLQLALLGILGAVVVVVTALVSPQPAARELRDFAGHLRQLMPGK